MARRKKEEPIVHQNRIALAAMNLFAQKGIDNTKMDEIAKEAGYGKATLYVYFQNKEDIVSFIAYESMGKLLEALERAVGVGSHEKETFFGICNALVDFQEKYPTFFDRSLEYIKLKGDAEDGWESKTYELGERINGILIGYMESIGHFDNYVENILLLWAMISGVIKMAAAKEEYLEFEEGITKEKFLKDGFEMIYGTLEKAKA